MQHSNKVIIEKLINIEEKLFYAKSVLTPQETANYIGISLSHLYRLTSSKQIPFSKPNGKLIFFSKEKIEEWLLNNPQL